MYLPGILRMWSRVFRFIGVKERYLPLCEHAANPTEQTTIKMILPKTVKLNDVACQLCSRPLTISSIEKTPLCQTAEMYSGYSGLQNFQLFAAAYR